MSLWVVEIDDDFLSRLAAWSVDRQKELYAIQVRLRSGGPEAMGLIKSELEGVPAWRDLSGPVSLRLPVNLPSGWKVLELEVQPDFRLVVTGLG